VGQPYALGFQKNQKTMEKKGKKARAVRQSAKKNGCEEMCGENSIFRKRGKSETVCDVGGWVGKKPGKRNCKGLPHKGRRFCMDGDPNRMEGYSR